MSESYTVYVVCITSEFDKVPIAGILNNKQNHNAKLLITLVLINIFWWNFQDTFVVTSRTDLLSFGTTIGRRICVICKKNRKKTAKFKIRPIKTKLCRHLPLIMIKTSWNFHQKILFRTEVIAEFVTISRELNKTLTLVCRAPQEWGQIKRPPCIWALLTKCWA